jgi:hypothetical protein
MMDEKKKGAGQTGAAVKPSRQDRLKLALRENLRRRKSQAKARGDATIAPSNRDDASPHDASGKKPDK